MGMDFGQLTTRVCHDGCQHAGCQTLLLWVSLGPAPPGPVQVSLQPPPDSRGWSCNQQEFSLE